ncbi:hypothetical protein KUW18_19595, partial [Halomonas sp. DP5Y7-2]|uniref:hypothetical protein n=1 Tax=Halomonas sp. DP5Y7-2 TaxID=2859076 RepID=UPI001C997E4E
LAAWGKQGRDYLQLLSEHDHTDVEAMSALLDGAVDLFLEPNRVVKQGTGELILEPTVDNIEELI